MSCSNGTCGGGINWVIVAIGIIAALVLFLAFRGYEVATSDEEHVVACRGRHCGEDSGHRQQDARISREYRGGW